MSQNNTAVVLDLETPRTFHDVGGRDRMHLLGISVCGVYFYETDTYRAFRASELLELEEYFLSRRPTVIGFNQIYFDLPVLRPYCTQLDLSTLPTIDIMQEVQKSEGIRLKLETLAQGTLLEGKSGDGLDAVRYYRMGDWDNLIRYCLDDVRITRALYEYGLHHGCVYYQQAGEHRAIPVSWGRGTRVQDLLVTALQQHQQVEILYRELRENGKPMDQHTIADIRRVDRDRVWFYAHDAHEEKELPVRFVLQTSLLSTTAVHQAVLF